MLRTVHFFSFLALFAFAACSGGGESSEKKEEKAAKEAMKQIDSLQQEVMDVHDEMMPKMEDLKKMRDEASKLADSLKEEGDTMVAAKMDKARQALEKGQKSMMDWMRNFERPADTAKSGEVIQYLKDQEKKVKEMRDSMKASMKEAKKRLEEFKKSEEEE